MYTNSQAEAMVKRIPEDVTGEDRRAAYSTITGCRDGKTPREISRYYSIDLNLVTKWMDFFNLENSPAPTVNKRGRKSKDLKGFVTSNIGRVVTPKTVAEELGISLPTFYNFYNANRGFFKKVKRGEFQIINPEELRNSGE